ncbi:J domain-containing protein [Sneathiella litorea]|uniref:DnaJ domain-containing protein n=1 Tax=Sneathiella litorea TaxID=2606216 RepID=A0A6L8W473_9PROT|nr:J domain-containing protein [Sneathiella litorea]MZR29284.1 DnaJ domain-containing protein [Sneathiella litorea]
MSKNREIPLGESASEPLHRQCDHSDCFEAGEYRAPKARLLDRGKPTDYQWFCLGHIREFNKSWNFFDGMTAEEVLRYKDEDITGHRPTWKLGTRTASGRKEYRYDDPFDFRDDMGASEEASAKAKANGKAPIDPKEREALAVLNLQPGCDLDQIKRRHKELAKKYHPDIRGGDKEAEEILKNINQAYTLLRSCANS